jgi:hypothetical protein
MKNITFQDGMVGNAIITNTNPVTVLTGMSQTFAMKTFDFIVKLRRCRFFIVISREY